MLSGYVIQKCQKKVAEASYTCPPHPEGITGYVEESQPDEVMVFLRRPRIMSGLRRGQWVGGMKTFDFMSAQFKKRVIGQAIYLGLGSIMIS